MIQTTLAQIEEKIRRGGVISDEQRQELLTLLSDLKEEVADLSETRSEDAESITRFTGLSAHEATRQEINPRLLALSLEGLKSSVDDFEQSHPKLAETVNSLCHILSNMGI
jgi:hypothetical protein